MSIRAIKIQRVWLLVLAAVGSILAQSAGAGQVEKKALRIYLMGSSLTDQVNYRGFQALAEFRGYEHIWGRHVVPGAPIRWLWNHRDRRHGFMGPFGPCGEALAEYRWDAITLEPRNGYDRELQAANELIAYAVRKSPDVQFYVFAQWPRIGRGSYDRQWLSRVKDIQNNIRLGFEEFLTDLREAHPDIKPLLMIPVGHAFHLLQHKIKAGLVPGMSSIFDGYSDRSHQNHLGEYIVGCTFFATVYRETPVGLPTEPYGEIAPDLARTIQETVWEAVNAHPRSGVKAPGEFKIITPYLPDAVEGSPYDRELHAAFGRVSVEYSLADGGLPPGIEVAPEGRITGSAPRTGDYSFTVKAVDAHGATATRELQLTCVGESKPIIPEQDLPAMQRGKHVELSLKAEGGNGDITWRLARCWKKVSTDGKEDWQAVQRAGRALMPEGLELSFDGIISGSPGLAGVYRLLVVAEDSDPTEPDSAQRELIFDIAEAGPHVYFVPPATEKPTVDGKLDEPFWELDRSVVKPVMGQASCKATFGALWNRSNLWVAVKVEEDRIVTDSEKPWHDDGVEVFVDTLNDCQKEYNADDLRIVVSSSGRTFLVGRDSGDIEVATARTDGGYVVEMRVAMPRRNRRHNAYGFDIAVNDDDDGGGRDGQLVWQGTGDNDTDPSGFGTILLVGENGS